LGLTCSPEIMPLVRWLVSWRRVMRRSRFSEDQIIGVLREHEAGVKTAGLCRKHGISDATFYTWKSKYGGLTVADAARLRALAIDVDQGIKGEQVVATMARISSMRGAPRTIRVDNGPEFIAKALDRWAYENGVTLDFSRPGKSTDNAFAESFNDGLCDECLNAHWFLSLADARARIEAWRRDYNESRPNTSLWLADAGRTCCRRGQDRRGMNAGYSRPSWLRNRETLKRDTGRGERLPPNASKPRRGGVGACLDIWLRGQDLFSHVESHK